MKEINIGSDNSYIINQPETQEQLLQQNENAFPIVQKLEYERVKKTYSTIKNLHTYSVMSHQEN